MASNSPTVAIVTPVYNGATYLRETMLSVQAQTYPHIVHFVLDNASTDATPGIIGEFSGSRIPVVSQRNPALLNIGQNWNRCVQLGARGSDYFRVVCADDPLPPTSIEKMVALAQTDPLISAVGCDHDTNLGHDELRWDRSRSVFDGIEAARLCLIGECAIVPVHLLFRTDVLSLREKFFDENLLHFDAETAFFVMARENTRFGYVHETLSFTRRHAGSITSTVATPLRIDFLDWYIMVERYGERLLSPAELRKYKRFYERHYYGRMLAWRYLHNNRKAFDWHKKALASLGAAPGLWSYADAIVDYGLRKMHLRRRWTQFPF